MKRPSRARRRSFRIISLCACFAVLLSSLAIGRVSMRSTRAARASTNPVAQAQPFRPNEVLVKFRDDASENDRNAVALAHGTRRGNKLRGQSGIEKLNVPAGQTSEAFAALVRGARGVEFSEPNYLVTHDQFKSARNIASLNSLLASDGVSGLSLPRLTSSDVNANPLYPGVNQTSLQNLQNESLPNDSRFNEQWALSNTGQNLGTFGSDIHALGAWEKSTGSVTTVIAVIDSGIDFTHPDLTHNKWTNSIPSPDGDVNGWDYVTDSAVIKDEQGHGTAVAGIIAAEGNNEIGVAGVMWRASLMSLRVLDGNGTGDIGSAVEAIDYAVSHGAQVINISWGTSAESVALKQALQRATNRGVLIVCSAGNGGRDIDRDSYYPASYRLQNVVSVAATDNVDRLALWSNYGNRSVNVAAPGINILTTQMGGSYAVISGTSAAAPLVTGIAGLIKSVAPWLTARDIDGAIGSHVRKANSLAQKVSTGGIVNAADSLQNLQRSLALPPRPIITGGTGPGGSFETTPPPRTTAAPSHAPNLDEIRRTRPASPRAKTPIESNLMCADCDPYGGGGGGGNYPAGDPNFSTARMRPPNQTGQTGVDLGSRNFNWGVPIVSLPGRAGLDLNLTLYLNSLVWTKDGSFIKYNGDLGSPSPGFQLGLPKLQQRFTDAVTGTYAYVMVTPSGGRVEMRQVGTSNIYEAQDGSYTQLDTNTMIVRTTDGTQFAFVGVNINGEYRCTQIKDRNGNYISATYDVNNGHLLDVTDTLGRVITFNYDGNGNLSAVQQRWGGVTHNWATFFYGQVWIAPAFGGGLQINGPNNTSVTVLTQVSLHNGSSYTFEYNTAFGQVRRINHYESDGRLRNYTWYNMASSAGQTDCPRFTEQHDWAEMWNNSNEVVSYFGTAVDGSWGQQTMPDGTVYNEFFATTGWQSGLTTSTEVWSGGVRKKWTTTAWTQDDISLTYQKNPRVIETNSYDDAGNRQRVGISYGNYAAYSLPYEILEYAADGTTPWRSKYIDYNLGADYVNRRIIGLPMWIHIVDHTIPAYVSKLTFEYDWDNSTNTYLVDQGAATQHDNTNYGAGFRIGRGNLCAVRRWNVTGDAINDWNQAMWLSFTGYNTNGSLIMSADGLGHETRFGYSDSFSDGLNRNSFAYRTTVTDGDNFSSTAEYSYDFAALTRTQGPPPTGQSQGLIQTLSYDGAGRLERVTTANTGAYTRYVYGPYYLQGFSSVNNVADDAYSCKILDGFGRVIQQSANHPGSTGGYIGQLTTYDVMGRAVQQTNPTEITAAWIPTGDDAAGWVWSYQGYDWKGRPTLTTLPDGNTRENIYGGCGCAGGEVVTSRDERGRRRRSMKDVAGRLKQVDELNWDQSIYSTTVYAYNALDQNTQINQTGQIRTFEYDGHGRLWRRTTPEQGPTTYNYYADDVVQTITDARGATTTFGYNNRHKVTSLTYGVPAGVAATPNVSFGYDAAGNRTSMTDGLGSMTYAYDQLSRLTGETRTFTGVGTFSLGYTYNLAGELTAITNPWNVQVGYSYDTAGRPTSVSGANYAGVTSYVNSISYRAFAMKQIGYANGRTTSMGYDSRLRPTQYSIPGVLRLQYEYGWENSGRAEFVRNLDDQTLDRWFAYDHVGRLSVSRSGTEARIAFGEQIPVAYDGPYSQGYAYDVWGNRTHIEGWGGVARWADYTYTNNRRDGMQYDAAGNITNDGGQSFSYDATGQQATASYSGYLLQQYYDGDGLRTKKYDNGDTIYYVRSSVLGGQVIAEIYGGGVSYSGSGWWLRGYVYLGQRLIALQAGGVFWTHQDPLSKSQRLTDINGNVVSTIELDPFGGDTSRSQNAAVQPHRFTTYDRDGNATDDAMFRRYNRWWAAFDQPDPYDGSYNLGDPQSLNRYTYVQNDPVNFTDPTGLMWIICQLYTVEGSITGGYCVINPPDWRGFEPKPGGGGGRPVPPTQQPPTTVPKGDLRKAIEDILKKRDCEEYLQKLLNEANKLFAGNYPHIKTFWEGFDKISAAGGYQLIPGPFHTVSGDLFANGARPATVHIIPFRTYGTPTAANISYAQTSYYPYAAMHETFHLAGQGGYNDEQMARAAYSLAGKELPAGDRNVWGWSNLFDQELMQHCPKEGK